MPSINPTSPPAALIAGLRERGRRRAWLVTNPDSGEVLSSDPSLAGLARATAVAAPDFRQHEAIFFEVGADSGHLLTAFIHRTTRGQAAGGVRFWGYLTIEALVRDGLRLSVGMGHKCALAGLWWGGGKGIIARHPGRPHTDPEVRRVVYRDYGRFITGIRGCYVTAEDAGTTPPDMAEVFRTTRHTTCIPPGVGGSGNPSVLTATGVVVAMEAALAHRGATGLAGKRVALQGLGNVSRHMIGDLLERGVATIVGADISQAALDGIRARYPDARLDLRLVAQGDDSILEEPCDVLAPNALGGTLNRDIIPGIRASVVCGAANNQLLDPGPDALRLTERGVVYVPDFLANRMGIVNCANEQYGVLPDDPAIRAHLERETEYGIHQRTLEVLTRAANSGRTTHDEAVDLADALSEEPHPIWPDRGRAIIDSLVTSGWADG